MNDTLEYYSRNADRFADSTKNVDFHITQDRFLECLPAEAAILDFGCGSGRDTRYFLEKGYKVEATDGSPELCKLASEYAGIPVKCQLFQELDAVEKYDGTWACASILHLSTEELRDVMYKMSRALKSNGIIYTSFKYGDFEGERNGRYFHDFTPEGFQDFIKNYKELDIIDLWITGDVRPGRGEEQWLNILLRKLTTR